MDSRSRIEMIVKAGGLDEDEKKVLAVLVREGYGRNGTPLGRVGAVSADDLTHELGPVITDRQIDTEIEGDGESMKAKSFESRKRQVRAIINRLIIRHGIPIMCEPGRGGGYYLPAFDLEVEANHRRFHRRAMTGLMKDTRATRTAWVDAVVQLTMDYDGPVGDAVREQLRMPREEAGPPAFFGVITQFLRHIQGDPQRYASEIRELQELYGDIFVPRHKVAELRELSGKLQRALRELEPAGIPDREGRMSSL